MRRCLALLAIACSSHAADIGPYANLASPRQLPMSLAQQLEWMFRDAPSRALCTARGLDLMSLTWEDTGRTKNSCWGANISDATIQVLDGGSCSSFMPVMRHPNFADTSCDVPISRLKVLVGNEHGSALRAIDLGAYLDGLASYQHSPTGYVRGCLRAGRDQEVLVSAQACLLPVGAGGKTEFAPVLFNYQSSPGNPAVLVILATPEGTSAQVMDANGQACAGVVHGQRLFHNRDGQRALLEAQRFSDHEAARQPEQAGESKDARAAGLSMALIIQVPLKHAAPPPPQAYAPAYASAGASQCVAACTPVMEATDSKRGMETAVVASGSVDGPWIGLDGCTIERDESFPIRATVQFYQATDSSRLTEPDLARIAGAIDRIYLDADAVGSLVVDGMTGRATETTPPPAWPAPWWQGPCERYTASCGESWTAALARIHARLGAEWTPSDARELVNALALVRP